MKKKIFIQLILAVFAQTVVAQPSAVKNAAKSVFSLTTYRADGTVLATSNGVFVGTEGEGVSDLKPFLGAARAEVVDASGKKMNVVRMVGLNDIYDVARFRVDGKTTPANVSNVPSTVNQEAWLVTYAQKSPQITSTKVKSVEKFMDKYNYYIFGMNAPDNATGCPFVNMYGQVIGLLQMSKTSFDTHACDVNYVRSLTTNGFSANNAYYRQIAIPIALPQDENQARLMLMTAGQGTDSLKAVSVANDFIEQFPTATDGYNSRANIEAAAGQWSQAEQTMQLGIKKSKDKDEAHYNYARLMFGYATYNLHWTLDDAMKESEAAYKEKPLPLYRHLQGEIFFRKGEYQRALDIFKELSNDKSYSTNELLYEQAQCMRNLKAPNEQVLALLDSAINTTDTLRILETAPYYYTRAQVYVDMERYRDATFDYTRYEYLKQGLVGADFYYEREQAELKGKLFQQALNDIARAIKLNPREPVYYAEMANVQLRVNKVEEAIMVAKRCTEIAPDYAEGYLVLGLAQVQNNQKAEGLANLQKAKELGSDQAEPLIEKYK